MRMPISEITDRCSICLLKHERIPSEREMLAKELAAYKEEMKDYAAVGIGDYLIQLKEINGKIWDLESDIRKGKEGELGLEEVGRRAIAIRELNKMRVGIKNEMVKKFNEGYLDVKVNHASQ